MPISTGKTFCSVQYIFILHNIGHSRNTEKSLEELGGQSKIVLRQAKLYAGRPVRQPYAGVNYISHSEIMNLATVVCVWWGGVLQPLLPLPPPCFAAAWEYKRPTELVKRFAYRGDFTSAQGHCQSYNWYGLAILLAYPSQRVPTTFPPSSTHSDGIWTRITPPPPHWDRQTILPTISNLGHAELLRQCELPPVNEIVNSLFWDPRGEERDIIFVQIKTTSPRDA